MDKNLKDLVESVAFIRDNMLTRDDAREIVQDIIAEMDVATRDSVRAIIREEVPPLVRPIIQEEVPGIIRDETAWLRGEITDLRATLEELRERVKDHAALTKEIDYAFQRLVVIEKHIGIAPPGDA